MTSRQAGRRMATISAQRKRQTGRSGVRQPGRRKDESMRPKERRQFLQLVICCGIFVLLVAAKFLLPSRMAQINEVLSRAMEQNMDVQAVFSAVGRAFSGESGMSGTVDEVYRAVFHPDGTEEALETSAHIPASQGIAAMAALQAYLPLGEAETAEDIQEETPEEQVSNLAYVLYSNQNLPEDVSMEQAILNFDYCTPVSGH